MSSLNLRDVALAYGPIQSWPGQLRSDRERQAARFEASWSVTERELRYELARLGAPDASVLLDVTPSAIRIDGQLRARTRPSHPGVLVVFDHPEAGRLQFAADLYGDRRHRDGWRDNVRAVVKTLEALRAVDRHGASSGAAQFRGYAALPAPIAQGGPTHLTPDLALRRLEDITGRSITEVGDPAKLHRLARAKAHPDVSGDPDLWAEVEQAWAVLS